MISRMIFPLTNIACPAVPALPVANCLAGLAMLVARATLLSLRATLFIRDAVGGRPEAGRECERRPDLGAGGGLVAPPVTLFAGG